MEYYSAIKRNEMELFVVRWMDLESVLQSEVSQAERQIYITYMWNLKKNDTNELIYKTETDTENKLMVTKGENGVRDKLGVRD